jgi:hypothetical protein
MLYPMTVCHIESEEQNKTGRRILYNDKSVSFIFHQQYRVGKLFVCTGFYYHSLSLYKNNFAVKLRFLIDAAYSAYTADRKETESATAPFLCIYT